MRPLKILKLVVAALVVYYTDGLDPEHIYFGGEVFNKALGLLEELFHSS